MKKTLKLDNDTKKVLSDQEKIKRLTEHEGWPIVEKLLLNKAAELLNMSGVNVQNPLGGNLVAEIGMRQLASARILEVLADVKGTAEQFSANQSLTEQIETSYVYRMPPVRR